MARTNTGTRLTEQQRIAQVRLAVLVVAQMRQLWALLDAKDLANTVPGWLDASLRLVQQQYGTSSTIARRYYQAIRTVETGASYRAVLPTPEFVDRPAQVSLMVTGPVRIARAIRDGVDGSVLQAAIDTAFAESARAAAMRVLDGGRDQLVAAVDADSDALGYARAAAPNACAFCLMLASRGPVYGADSADFQAHAGCGCTAEPVFSRDQAWPEGSREARDLWDSSGGFDDFRKAVEGGGEGDAGDTAA